MEPITRNLTDLAADERAVFERFVGQHLSDNQQIVVQVLGGAEADSVRRSPPSIADYAILADLDAASRKSFDEAIERSPSRDQPTL